MTDVFTPYEVALKQLLERLGKEHPRYSEATTFRGRLLENIAHAQRHGDTETRRAERSQIREGMDRLARGALDISFTDLVFSPAPAEVTSEPSVTMAGRVFLAYSHQDQVFAHRLAANLRDAGVPLWVDRWDIPVGTDWDWAIDDAVYECGHFLVVLSPPAVASREVRGELRIALDEGKPIVSVLYKDCRVPRQLRMIQYVDYTSRGPDDQAALLRILRALGVERPGSVHVEEEPVPVSQPQPVPIRPVEKRPEPEMVLIPAGQFLMGSSDTDKEAYSDEKPQHTLYLPDYYLARTPVTNEQYKVFVQSTRCEAPKHWEGGRIPEGKENHPVVWVTWHDALAYCRWLAKVTGKPYTLPSEVEWEKGARGTDGRIYPWGNEWDPKRCNSGEGSPGDTMPVGAYPEGASPYGLLDMVGNVWEWTRSLREGYPYNPEDGREDLVAEGSRAVRGGSWVVTRSRARCSYRNILDPTHRYHRSGFRVLLAPAL